MNYFNLVDKIITEIANFQSKIGDVYYTPVERYENLMEVVGLVRELSLEVELEDVQFKINAVTKTAHIELFFEDVVFEERNSSVFFKMVAMSEGFVTSKVSDDMISINLNMGGLYERNE